MIKEVATSDIKVATSEHLNTNTDNKQHVNNQLVAKKRLQPLQKKVATSALDNLLGRSLKQEELEKAILLVCRDNYIKKTSWLKYLESRKITCGIK